MSLTPQDEMPTGERTSRSARALRAGLLGRGIALSRSPGMHEAEGARLGLTYSYELFDFDRLGLADDDLPALVADLGRKGYAGVNVTHPFKERVVDCLDALSDDARIIGAVNTVVFSPGGTTDHTTTGHNTDCWGFAESFRRDLPLALLNDVLLLGAGGAGRAVAKALLDLGTARLTIVDADVARAEGLARRIRDHGATSEIAVGRDLPAVIGAAAGLVNATPVGMAKYPGTPVDPALLRPDMWVADIVYFPVETALLRIARETGCAVLSGAGMAIMQAVMAFSLITGIDADADWMARHFQSV